MEVLNEVPRSTSFTLLDNNLKMLPSDLAENVQLQSFNVLEDFPKYPEWKGQFDLIHQAMMVAAYTTEQWRQVLREYYDLLKPGGYIQLLEFDFAHMDSGPWQIWGKDWCTKLAGRRNINLFIAQELVTLLGETGFTVVRRDERHPRFTDTSVEQPYPNAISDWYFNTVTAGCVKGHELGMISGEEWHSFQTGLKEESKNLKSEYEFKAVMIVARVNLSATSWCKMLAETLMHCSGCRKRNNLLSKIRARPEVLWNF